MKEMILAHVEKAVLGICVLLMGLFLYMSFSQESYKRKPEDFAKVASEARKKVDANDPQVDDLKPGNFPKAAEGLTKPIDERFDTRNLWRRAFDFGTVFRNQPKILQPHKPALQDNRGLMGQFLTGPDGKRLMKKVKKSSQMFVAKGGGGGAGGMMMGGGDDDDAPRGNSRRGGMRGPGGAGGVGGGMGAGGLDGGGGGARGGFGRGMFGGNEGMGGGSGFGLGSGYGDGDEGGMGNEGSVGPGRAAPGVGDRKNRIVLGETVIKKKETKEDKNKKKAVEKDEYVEEPRLNMVGRRWVEIVAVFPHADQIKEFVKALREPAVEVGLRYDMPIIQRYDLQADLSWSAGHPIDLNKQYNVIDNAYSFQAEPFPQVTIKGLAMNIPLLQTQFKEFLTLPEFKDPERYIYDKEFLDMTINAPVRSKTAKERIRAKSKYSKEKKDGKDAKLEVSRIGKRFGKQDLSRPKDKDGKDSKDEKEKQQQEDRNIFNNHHEVKFAMIRFFDFTVEPNRRYKYDVAVQTYNPNYLRNDVASGDISTSPVLTGPPSEVSDDVLVDGDVHWYVVKQDAKAADNLSPRAKLEVHWWDDRMGEWLVAPFLHRLGDYIGASGVKKIVKKIRFDESTLKWKLTTESSEQDFNAHAILVDLRGGNIQRRTGESASINFRLPREVIAVNQFGDLVRHDQDTDVSDVVRKAVAANYAEIVTEMESSERPAAGNQAPGSGKEDNRGRRKGGEGGGRGGGMRGSSGLGGGSAG